MKIWQKIVLVAAIVVIGIPAAALIALHSPSIQTALCRKAASIFSEQIDGEVSVGRVTVALPGMVLLKDVLVTQDGPQDTVLSVAKLFADARLFALMKGDLIVDKVRLEDGGVRMRNITDSTTNISLLLSPFTSGPRKEPSEESFLKNLSVKRITARNLAFSRVNRFADTVEKVKANPRRINFNDLDVTDLNLDVRRIRYGDGISMKIQNISLSEKCGFNLRKLEGDVCLDSLGLSVTDFFLEDGDSRVAAPKIALLFDDFSAFEDFINDVAFDVDIKDIHFDFKTLEHFLGEGMPLAFDGTVKLEGPVSNIRSNRMKIYTENHRTYLDLTAHLNGLPDIGSSLVDVNVLHCQTTSLDVANLLGSLDHKLDRSSISKLAPGEVVTFKGSLQGMLDDFVAYGHIGTSTMGDIHMNLMCEKQEENKVGLDGSLLVDELDLGGILSMDKLGELTCAASIDGYFGKETNVRIDSMEIAHFEFNGYDYNSIKIDGILHDNEFDGAIFCDDPNLNFSFDGVANLAASKGEPARYKFDLDLKNADLHALNFDRRDVSKISLKADADITVAPDGNLRGEALVSDILATLENGPYELDDIELRAYFAENRYLMGLTSGFAKVRYRGSASIGKFIGDVVNLAGKKSMDHVLGAPTEFVPDDYKLTLTTRNLQNLCAFFVPGLYVADSTVVDLELASSGSIKGRVVSDLIAYNNNYVQNLRLGIANPDTKSLRIDGDMDLVQSGDLEFKNNTIDIAVDNNIAELEYAFDNKSIKQTRAKLCAAAEFCDKDDLYRIIGSILPSELVLSDLQWNLSPAKIRYRKDAVNLDNFRISSGQQFVRLDGMLSADPSDTIVFRVNKIDASAVNGLLAEDMGVKGIIDAEGLAFGVLGDDMGLQLELLAKGLGFKGSDLGDLNAESVWNAENKRFELKVRNTIGEKRPLAAEGYYVPSNKTACLNASFEEFGLSWIEPLVPGLVTNVGGSLSGDILATGPLNKLEINSNAMRFNKFAATLDYTKVPYFFDGPFSVNSKGVRFNNVIVSDQFGKTGTLSGSVDYDHFKDIALNMRFRLNDMQALNTRFKDNSSFFGQAFATGTVSLRGPLERIKISIRATTEDKTSVQIPLGGGSQLKTSMLTFVNNSKQMSILDSLRIAGKEKEEKAEGGTELDVNLQLTATPAAVVQLVVDPSTGDAVKARGSGIISIVTGPTNPLSLNGLYTIDEGSYRFSLMGLVSKDFAINSGSKVSLNGDIMDTELDLTATYRTKASISTLIADSTAVGNRRYVDCGIKVTGKLENPQIDFNIDIPDLEPSTKGRVDAALSTEEKRMQQVLALLVSGSFVPDEQSGIVNNTTILYSNASEIMSNQLNKILQRLDIPIDFGFNYQPTERGTNLFDVAISTQLFNNRVTINGNIGNRQYMSSSGTDVVGDIDVQIKVNKSGDLRFNLFSHSADEYSNFVDQTQRNGIGFVYQKEFDTWGEFMRKTFWSKTRQEQYDLEQQELMRQQIVKRMRELNMRQQLPAVTPIVVPHID